MRLDDPSLFADVSDFFGIGNPAIAEKDYYIVQLLKLLCHFDPQYHILVFAGGTALTKADLKLHRMSEDVDIKLVIRPDAGELSGNAMRKERRELRDRLLELIDQHEIFSVDKESIKTLDEHRYIEIPIEYPQQFNRAPCLRPFIKLELVETELLAGYEVMPVRSLLAEAMERDAEVAAFNTVYLIATHAEKILSMLRRTAWVNRYPQRSNDDETLVRHIYDSYYLQQSKAFAIRELAELLARGIDMDRKRYGNQHPEFVSDPLRELRYGLALLGKTVLYRERYEAFVNPMVYGDKLAWAAAFDLFAKVATQVLDHIEQYALLKASD